MSAPPRAFEGAAAPPPPLVRCKYWLTAHTPCPTPPRTPCRGASVNCLQVGCFRPPNFVDKHPSQNLILSNERSAVFSLFPLPSSFVRASCPPPLLFFPRRAVPRHRGCVHAARRRHARPDHTHCTCRRRYRGPPHLTTKHYLMHRKHVSWLSQGVRCWLSQGVRCRRLPMQGGGAAKRGAAGGQCTAARAICTPCTPASPPTASTAACSRQSSQSVKLGDRAGGGVRCCDGNDRE